MEAQILTEVWVVSPHLANDSGTQYEGGLDRTSTVGTVQENLRRKVGYTFVVPDTDQIRALLPQLHRNYDLPRKRPLVVLVPPGVFQTLAVSEIAIYDPDLKSRQTPLVFMELPVAIAHNYWALLDDGTAATFVTRVRNVIKDYELDDANLTDASESLLAQAIEDSFLSAWLVFGRLPCAYLHEEQHLVWLETALPDDLLNGVLRSRLTLVQVEPTIEALKTHFVDQKMPMSWYVGSSTQPLDLGSVLEAHGFALAEELVGMAIDLQQLNPDAMVEVPDLVIRQVIDMPTLRAWVNVFRVGFAASDVFSEAMLAITSSHDLSPDSQTFLYLGVFGDTPSASATLLLSNGVAGIYDVTTIPQARGKGLGMAVTLQALLDGRAKGYRFGVLQSSEMARGMYHRLGFRGYSRIRRYTFPPGHFFGVMLTSSNRCASKTLAEPNPGINLCTEVNQKAKGWHKSWEAPLVPRPYRASRFPKLAVGSLAMQMKTRWKASPFLEVGGIAPMITLSLDFEAVATLAAAAAVLVSLIGIWLGIAARESLDGATMYASSSRISI